MHDKEQIFAPLGSVPCLAVYNLKHCTRLVRHLKPESMAVEAAAQRNSTSYFKLFTYAQKFDIFLLLLGTAASLVHGAITPSITYLFGRINDAYGDSAKDANEAFHTAFQIVRIVLYVGIGQMVSTAIETSCWMLVGENVTSQIKKRYLRSLLSQEVGYYDMGTSTGDITNAICSDSMLLHDAVGEKVGAFLYNISVFLVGLIISCIIFWRMALIGLTAIPLLLAVGGAYITFYTKFSIQATTAFRNADIVTEQALSQVRTVYSFVGEKNTLSRISKSLQDAVDLSSKTGLSKGLGLGITMATAYLSWALFFWYGGTAVKKHQIKGGSALALVVISLYNGRSVGECLRLLECIAKGKAASGRLFEVIERKTAIDSSEGEIPARHNGSIEFCNVCFSYPSRPDVPIFNDLSLEIPPGRMVAFVGHSGSGKSSIVSLINRFYDPQAGEIRIGGMDIKRLQLNWLRRQIGFVSQEPTLFAATIRENIMLGSPGASHEQLIKASRTANAHDFISELPDAYNTQVGNKGMQLSGGQKQRIAIARAMLKEPGILLLDEATSALDSESELLVQRALDTIMHRKTTVVIAHRLSTIRNADTIVVLDKGQVVESGTHDELISREVGTYATLVRLQHVERFERNETVSPNASPSHEYIRSPSASSIQSQASRRNSLRSLLLMRSPKLKSPCSSPANQTAAARDAKEILLEKSKVTARRTWWFFKVLRGNWGLTVTAGLGACIGGAATGVFPLFMAKVLVLLLQKQVEEANKWIIGITGLAAVALVGNLVQYYFGYTSGANTSRAIQELSLEGILRNEIGWFDLDDNSGFAITGRLSSNATTVRNAASDTYGFFLHNSLAITLTIIFAFINQWKIALLASSFIPLQVIGTATSRTFVKGEVSGNVAKWHEKASQVAGEAASGIRTVYSLGAEDHMLGLFTKHLLNTKFERLKRVLVLGVVYGLAQSTMVYANALGLWFGLSLVRSGQASFGPVLTAFTILAYGALTCDELLRMIPDLLAGASAFAAMFQIATRKSLIDPESSSGKELEQVAGNIELDNVTFMYPTRPERVVLANLQMNIKAGSTVALVGSSGSGKSSIVALVQRFYDPSTGRILLDGCDIRTLDLRWLRRRIGFVQQEPMLFAQSIRENIVFGKQDAKEAEVVEAAKNANAHDFISSLPQGYETQVGEMGTQLSGGQKQRIAIARAIIKQPAILLLDEATSSLDSESEQAVQAALEDIVRRNEMTTLVVAHRLSTIQHTDSIVVLDKGSVIERGTHQELLARDKFYSKLVRSQP